MSKQMYPTVLEEPSLGLLRIATHPRMRHLHFDIAAPNDVANRGMELFVAAQGGEMSWSNFASPTVDEVRGAFEAQGGISDQLARLLCDPDRSGAPSAHLSARKEILPAASGDGQLMWNQLRAGGEAMRIAGLTGYIELEEVSCRHVLTPALSETRRSQEMPKFTLAPFHRVPLSHPTVRRQFRTTEVHCTFEHIERADPRVFEVLLDAGLYTAYLRRADGKLKLIFTIQGFDPCIGVVYGYLYGWLAKCQDSGWITGPVTLKKEEIIAYAIVGDPDDCGLQLVVRPLSVIEGLASPK